VSLYVRCMPIDEIKKIIKFLHQQKLTIILIWWDREKWIEEFLDTKEYHIINLLWKTKILEVASILSDSILNISMDGWLMWLWHLMNKNNVSIQNTSVSIMQAPVDNIHSFNLREYSYPSCIPCSYYGEQKKWEKHRIKKCVFYGTGREGECRFATKWEHVIYLIKKILNKQQ
jgi:ADP-heptose:LPS heptosyltransferase